MLVLYEKLKEEKEKDGARELCTVATIVKGSSMGCMLHGCMLRRTMEGTEIMREDLFIH